MNTPRTNSITGGIAVMAACFLINSQSAFAGNSIWTGATDGTWTTGTNWSSTPTPPGSADTATVNLTGNITMGATQSVNNLVLGNAGTLNLDTAISANTLTLNGTGTTLSKTGNGNANVFSAIALANSGTFANSGAGNVLFNNSITGSGKDLVLDASSTGGFSILLGNNTIKNNTFGNLTISNGNLAVNVDAGTVSATTSALMGGTTLTVGDGTGAAASASFSVSGGLGNAAGGTRDKSAVVKSDGQINLQGGAMTINDITLEAGSSIIGNGLSRSLQLQSGNLSVTGSAKLGYTNTAGTTFDGMFDRLNVTTNTYTISSGATLDLGSRFQIDNASTRLIVAGGGTLLLKNAKGFTANGDAAIATNAGTFSLIARSGTIAVGADSLGTVTASTLGTNTITLGDASTPASADAALLITGGNYTVYNAITTATGGSGSTRTIGGDTAHNSTFSGNVTLGTDVRLTAATGGNSTFSGNITGTSYGVTKVGTGTVILTGSNSYTGTTTVSIGTLLINGDQSSATGTVSVSASATLGGNGTIGGAVTIDNNGILSPGTAGAATLTLNNKDLTISGLDSKINLDITGTAAGAFDKIAGIAVFAQGGDITFTLSGSYTSGDSWNVFSSASRTGNFDTIALAGSYSGNLTRSGSLWSNNNIGGISWQFDETLGTLSVVPEPAILALLAFSLTTVVALRRRRNV